MEAVPRLPMKCFELKVSPDRFPPEFVKLKQYIRDFYNEDPETYSTEIRNLETLRANAVHPAKDATGCAVLKKYFCQLHFLQSRFPIGRDDAVEISFVWKDAYSGVICTLPDIKFEMVNILYNIGALHSQLGAADDRTSPEGLKMACTHFQCAAWAFQHFKDSYPHPSGLDFSPDLIQFMYQLCLAQAQECILEKSMTDNRKATINAKVAAQIVDYYNLALSALLQGPTDETSILDTVGIKLFKSWKKYMKFKVSYYSCISLLYQGMQSEEQQKMGERIAYYQGALDALTDAMKLSKGLDNSEVVSEALIFTRDVVEGKRKAAKNENDFIYHEDIPELDSLPAIKGASLVKGIPFNVNDPEISGPDIFSRLVPMKAHEASSLYSEEKAKLLRRINSMIDAKDEEIVSFMSSLQLEYLRAHLDSPVLPQEVVDRCAALSAKPDAIPNLIAAMDKLNDAYHDVDGMLKEVMELIKIEEVSEKEYQELMGPRPPSIVATDLTREANKYMEAHKKAAESNETLHKAMTQHIENLRALQRPLEEIARSLPNLETLNVKDDPTLKEVMMLVDKVAEMRKQRAMLASQLRESICSDDITTQLVTRTDEKKEEIFEKEMQKHNKYVSLIEQNLSAQEKIIPALTDAYAKYAPTRKSVAEIMRQREMLLSALISSYDAYEDLIAKSNKGLEFYRKLETNLTKLYQRVKGTCKVQQEERDTILAKNNKKIEPSVETSSSSNITLSEGTGLKLKDYLQSRKTVPSSASSSYYSGQVGAVEPQQAWPPSVRPAPLGSEGTSSKQPDYVPYSTAPNYGGYNYGTDYAKSYMNPYYYQNALSVDLQNLQYPNLSGSSSSGMNAVSSPSPKQYSGTQLPPSQYNYSQAAATNYSTYDPNNPQYPSTQYTSAQGAASTGAYSSTTIPSANPYQQQYSQAASQIYQNPNSLAYSSQGSQAYQTPPTTQAYQSPGAGQAYQTPDASQAYQTPDAGQVYQTPGSTQSYQAGSTQAYQNLGSGHTYQTPDANQAYQPSSSTQAYQTPDANQAYQPSGSTQAYQTPDASQAYQTPDANQTYQTPDTNLAYQNPGAAQAYQTPGTTQNYQTPGTPQTFQATASQAYQPSVTQSYQTPVTQSYQPSVGQSYQNAGMPTVPTKDPAQQYSSDTVQNSYSNVSGTYNMAQPADGTYQPNVPYNDYAGAYQYSTQAQWNQMGYPYNPSDGTYSSNQTPVNQAYSGAVPQPSNPYGTQPNAASLSTTQNSQAYGNVATPTSDANQKIPSDQNVYNNALPDHTYYQNAKVSTTSATTDYASLYADYTNTYPNMQFQATPGTDTSHYSSAGGKNTFETNSSSVTPEGLTYANQYVASTVPLEYQNYYNQPYGYHYTMVNSEQPPKPAVAPQPANQPNSVTYIQAPSSGLMMTYSQQTNGTQPSTPEASKQASNVDLLTGLDFTITDAPPLQPLQDNKVIEQSQEKLANLSLEPKPTTNNQITPNECDNKNKQSLENGTTNSLEKLERPSPSKTPLKDPFSDPEVLSQFVQEVEKFEKFVEGLNSKTLNGPTPLDIKWNELQELQEKDAHKQIISVARCYPMKNRFSDFLPFDSSRVELPSTKDDYINASHVKELRPYAPNFIMTQAPLPSTYSDFWTMVVEQHAEIIVCLLGESQMNGEIYWAVNKTEDLVLGKIKVSLQSLNTKPHWIERIISVSDGKTSRVIMHLQFTSWPHSWMPESPAPFLLLVNEAVSVWSQQRGHGPIIVHCDSGVGKSGLFVLLTIATCELKVIPHLPDPITLSSLVASCRKNPLRDRAHLAFAYHCVLYYARDLLLKRGILASRSSFEEKRPKTKSHTRHPSEDFLLNSLKENNEERRLSDASSTGSGSKPCQENDPLSQIDPLWPIKRFS